MSYLFLLFCPNCVWRDNFHLFLEFVSKSYSKCLALMENCLKISEHPCKISLTTCGCGLSQDLSQERACLKETAVTKQR